MATRARGEATDTAVGLGFGVAVGAGARVDVGTAVAVFVRVVAADPNDPNTTYEGTHGPVAVLQILPDGQGVLRLDQ